MKLYKDHLHKAAEYSRDKNTRGFYFKHMYWALHLSLLLATWSVLMLIHAIIPQLVGFTVVEKLVNLVKQLKQQHPDDPMLQKITFDN